MNPPQGWVMKREYSDASRHVLLPKKGKLQKIQDDGKHRWIAQEMAPLLQKWGEYRVVFVGQTPLYAMLTTPQRNNGWDWHESKPYSLETLRYVVICWGDFKLTYDEQPYVENKSEALRSANVAGN
jgi:hypothetical protein